MVIFNQLMSFFVSYDCDGTLQLSTSCAELKISIL